MGKECERSMNGEEKCDRALVVEYRCLFTHDIVRKRKRWNDGYVKFHKFNKRMVIYDESRNYVAGTHWRGSDTIENSEEIMLRDEGIIVEIGEILGVTETDISQIIQKRERKKLLQFDEKSGLSVNNGKVGRISKTMGKTTLPAQLRHVPLRNLLGVWESPKPTIKVSNKLTVNNSLKKPYDNRPGWNSVGEKDKIRGIHKNVCMESGSTTNDRNMIAGGKVKGTKDSITKSRLNGTERSRRRKNWSCSEEILEISSDEGENGVRENESLKFHNYEKFGQKDDGIIIEIKQDDVNKSVEEKEIGAWSVEAFYLTRWRKFGLPNDQGYEERI